MEHAGSAIRSDTGHQVELARDASGNWVITCSLVPGEFHFKANNDERFSFGCLPSDEAGETHLRAPGIKVMAGGDFTITLSATSAGCRYRLEKLEIP